MLQGTIQLRHYRRFHKKLSNGLRMLIFNFHQNVFILQNHATHHAGHDFNMFKSQAGGACDCGDSSVMKESG